MMPSLTQDTQLYNHTETDAAADVRAARARAAGRLVADIDASLDPSEKVARCIIKSACL